MQTEVLDQRIERGVVAAMGDLDVGHIEGDGGQLLRRQHDLFGHDVEEFRGRVEEARNQPGARDAIDLGPHARHPPRGAPFTISDAEALGDSGQPRLLPPEIAAFQRRRIDAAQTQLGGCGLADFEAFDADRDDALAVRDLVCPILHPLMIPPPRAGDQPLLDVVILAAANIENDRRIGAANARVEVSWRDCEFTHLGAPLSTIALDRHRSSTWAESLTGRLQRAPLGGVFSARWGA